MWRSQNDNHLEEELATSRYRSERKLKNHAQCTLVTCWNLLSKYTNFKNQNLGTSMLFLSQKCFVQVTQDFWWGLPCAKNSPPKKMLALVGFSIFQKKNGSREWILDQQFSKKIKWNNCFTARKFNSQKSKNWSK